MSYNPVAIVIVLAFILAMVYIYYPKSENMISEQAYTLTSNGLNVPSRDGYYLGGLAVLNAVENADRTDQIIVA